MDDPNAYDLKSVKLPCLSGWMLRFFANWVESPLRMLLLPGLFESAGVNWLRKRHFSENPTSHPIHFTGKLQKEEAVVVQKDWPREGSRTKGFQMPTIFDYAESYRTGKSTPEEVAYGVLDSIKASDEGDTPLKAFIAVDRDDVLRQAHESTERIRAGNPFGILEGVPLAVKDEIDMMPYPTTAGTAFLGRAPVKEDATVVARLRRAGALLIGKTNMHEIGINVTGLNPHYGTTRNPYHAGRFTGGSSSGSAAAVAAGLVPAAIGADGGGSIRIPASFCGLVGLKATYGRISEHGAFPLDWSIAHIGPLTWSAADAALIYAVIAGPDPGDPTSLHQPLPFMTAWDDLNLKGIRMGVYWNWFRHADVEVVAACEAMLRAYEKMGCEVVEIVIPDLEAGRIAHSITITSEMAQAMQATYDEHHRKHGLDVRVTLALARQFTATDYIAAQRVRTRMIQHFKNALRQADVIVTPTTGIAAPKIKEGVLPDGESDLTTTIEIMRFATAANLTGLPAISIPVGYTQKGLPIGFQIIGRPWDESTLVRLALAAEQVVERRPPQVFYRFLH